MAKNLNSSMVGGINNNMPPSTSNTFPITGGEDWLELSVYADLSMAWESGLGAVFEDALKMAKEEGEEQVVQVSEHRMAIQSFGSHFGPFHYEYRAFDQNELVWWFRKVPVDHENIASVRVRIPGEACLCSDLSVGNLVLWIYRFFDHLKVPVRKIGLSRVDVCIDIPGMDVQVFRDAHMAKHYVTRSRSRAMDESGKGAAGTGSVNQEAWRFLESKGLTLYVGRSPSTLRAYNKLAELAHKMNPRKWQAMVERRWGGEVPEHATRIEFELRREALKAHGIDTIEDYFEKRAALVEYLCNEWFRYVQRPASGGKRKRRWLTHPDWKTVQQGFREVFKGRLDMDLSPLPKAECDVSALAKQAFGVVMKASECQGKTLSSYPKFMRYCAKFFQEAAKAKKYEEWFEMSGKSAKRTRD